MKSSVEQANTPSKVVPFLRPTNEADAEPEERIAFSEIALAQQFSNAYEGRLKYCATLKSWYEWTGSVWQPDTTRHAFDLARQICREAASDLQAEVTRSRDELQGRRSAAAISRASTVSAVEILAQADRRHAITVGELDCDPWTLNTRGGLVDLRTGEKRSSDPSAHCTKITGAAVGLECHTWRRFLSETFGGDEEVVSFVQRFLGYCSTGETCEHAFAFGYGSGGNGKSVLLSTVMQVLGDYAVTAPMETFVVSATDRHPAEVAMLRGARLAMATETEEGRRWAEARIKALTGGDPITARFMRQNFFTFRPMFKLFIVGNHTPAIRNVDQAIRRRLLLIPFNHRPYRVDTALPEKLLSERDGILGWLIDGCLQWQRQGLNPPAAIRQATEKYLDAEDSIGRWFVDAVEVDEALEQVTGIGDLFKSWEGWAKAHGEFVGTQKRFAGAMRQRGLDQGKDSRTRQTGFRGIRLIPPTNCGSP